MHFPDQRISTNWYGAAAFIIDLELMFCDFIAIEMEAFAAPTFQHMRTFNLTTNQTFDYSPGIFIGLRIEMIRIEKVGTANVGSLYLNKSALLRPLQGSLRSIDLQGDISIDMDRLFGVYRLVRMEYLIIKNQNNLHLLEHSNFCGLRIIRGLDIINCGVRAIHPHAFDYIGYTLSRLNLSQNQLTTLPSNIFVTFLEANDLCRLILGLEGNPWSCDCDLLETIYFDRIFNLTKFDKQPTIIDCSAALVSIHSCAGIQVIRPCKACIQSKQSFIYFARFNIRINHGFRALVVNSTPKRTYRLLFIDLKHRIQFQTKRPKCPSHNYIRQSTKCMLLFIDNELIGVPINIHDRSVYQMISLNYIAFDEVFTFWPYHCLVWRTGDDEPLREEIRWLLCLIGIVLTGHCVGLLIGMSYEWHRKKNNGTREAEVDAADDLRYDYAYELDHREMQYSEMPRVDESGYVHFNEKCNI